MNANSLFSFILYFLIYAILGWLCEVLFAWFKHHQWINRGFLIGPWCPIYGIGVVLLIVGLDFLKSNLVLLFLGSVLLTTIIEGLTGWILETLFHQRWWDYSKMPFNIHGYVCLLFSLIWGVAGVVMVDGVQPLIASWVARIPQSVLVIGVICLGCGFLVDFAMTVYRLIQVNHVTARLSGKLEELRLQVTESDLRALLKKELTARISDPLRAQRDDILNELSSNIKHFKHFKKAFPLAVPIRFTKAYELLKDYLDRKE